MPVASEMPRCAPPHTFGAGEEPRAGGVCRAMGEAAESRLSVCVFDRARIAFVRQNDVVQMFERLAEAGFDLAIRNHAGAIQLGYT